MARPALGALLLLLFCAELGHVAAARLLRRRTLKANVVSANNLVSMSPDAPLPSSVASKLVTIENDWKAQVELAARCKLEDVDKADMQEKCAELPVIFGKACGAIAKAFVHSNRNQKESFGMFMEKVCDDSVLQENSNWRQNTCKRFATGILKELPVRFDRQYERACHFMWIEMLGTETTAIKKVEAILLAKQREEQQEKHDEAQRPSGPEPAVVASKLVMIENDWKAQLDLTVRCNAEDVTGKMKSKCAELPVRFNEACGAIAKSFVRANKNTKPRLEAFMAAVCSDSVLTQTALGQWREATCKSFAQGLLAEVPVDNDMQYNKACSRMWGLMLKKETKQVEQAKEDSLVKKRAEASLVSRGAAVVHRARKLNNDNVDDDSDTEDEDNEDTDDESSEDNDAVTNAEESNQGESNDDDDEDDDGHDK